MGEVVAPLGEDRVQRTAVEVERNQYGGVDAASDGVHRGSLFGAEQDGSEFVGGQSSSSFSSKMTSPSRVRCTGQRATICINRSRWASGSSFGSLTVISKRVGEPRCAGSYPTVTDTSPMSQPLRSAYISSVTA